MDHGPREPKVVSPAEIRRLQFSRIEASGVVAEIWGPKVPPAFMALLHGPPSSGKSTLLVQLLESGTWDSCLLVASEEGVGLSVRDRLLRAEAMRTSVTDAATFPELLSVLRAASFNAVAIDSATSMGLEPREVLHLRREFAELTVLCAVQNTKSGNHRGSLAWAHDSDTVIQVHQSMRWKVTKSWFSQVGVEGEV